MLRLISIAFLSLFLTTLTLNAKDRPHVLILTQSGLANAVSGKIMTTNVGILTRLWKIVEQSSGTTNTPPSGPCVSEGESKTTSSSSEGTCTSDTGSEYACKCFYNNAYACSGGTWQLQSSNLQYCINLSAGLFNPAEVISIGD